MLCGVQRVKEAWELLGNPVRDDGTFAVVAITLQTADHDRWIDLTRYACTRPFAAQVLGLFVAAGQCCLLVAGQCAAMAAVASAGDAMYG
jgi:hypothetical protein